MHSRLRGRLRCLMRSRYGIRSAARRGRGRCRGRRRRRQRPLPSRPRSRRNTKFKVVRFEIRSKEQILKECGLPLCGIANCRVPECNIPRCGLLSCKLPECVLSESDLAEFLMPNCGQPKCKLPQCHVRPTSQLSSQSSSVCASPPIGRKRIRGSIARSRSRCREENYLNFQFVGSKSKEAQAMGSEGVRMRKPVTKKFKAGYRGGSCSLSCSPSCRKPRATAGLQLARSRGVATTFPAGLGRINMIRSSTAMASGCRQVPRKSARLVEKKQRKSARLFEKRRRKRWCQDLEDEEDGDLQRISTWTGRKNKSAGSKSDSTSGPAVNMAMGRRLAASVVKAGQFDEATANLQFEIFRERWGEDNVARRPRIPMATEDAAAASAAAAPPDPSSRVGEACPACKLCRRSAAHYVQASAPQTVVHRLTDLGEENLLLLVLEKLPPGSLLQASRVCRSWARQCEIVFKRECQQNGWALPRHPRWSTTAFPWRSLYFRHACRVCGKIGEFFVRKRLNGNFQFLLCGTCIRQPSVKERLVQYSIDLYGVSGKLVVRSLSMTKTRKMQSFV